ncbi:hypothetical protein HMPREF0765_4879 [Sphingobacterium spiritivorum ATCC 33300]|uniref:Outer membrane protein beta-barrel domain-containing protein n=2 Tax=Sphingobacterium spiritivorum TaxID=258 RepID=A0A380BQD9_SPHSI|nr:hypothetical protein [Sphingobacterium spiritivorum]EEI89512.1 hypothetical protein HMPREF0765_4879 [Sphingobacterium spiritivorum ATCC 33300]QQS94535.1 hypothetical protein I6J03_14170 [Sphingobacterium spiritivorum]SUJ04618.1 Uncharacterised protein [Sphingobacterium spiritivorum]
MKKAYLSALIIGILTLFAIDAKAQLTSDHAIGGRFGSAQGITYRYTMREDRAIEGIVSIQSNSTSRRFRVVGLYEFHKPLTGDFTWYYGFGGSVGGYTRKPYTDGNGNRFSRSSEAIISVDGIVGIEYSIPNAPVSISLDVKPYLDFIQSSSLKLIDPIGFSIRYKF